MSTDGVFAGGGYTGEEMPALRKSFLPISTYMVVTEPLVKSGKRAYYSADKYCRTIAELPIIIG